MTINTYFYAAGLLHNRVFTEENVRVNNLDELKVYMKKLFSAMKKKDGYNDVSFQLCSDSGFYVVVDRYDSESESFRTIFHERFNSCDSPVMKSQKNVLAWAIDIFKTDNGNSMSA